ncbi:MAG: hypothetical protein FWF15_05325 [Oscillospiraceae bacterium]|nr:hypothetical protein [Oscillospiraceae bacterium]
MAEKNYNFRKRLLEVHKPNRRNQTVSKKETAIEITSGWNIIIDANADRVIYNAARDLEDYFFKSMGVFVGVKTICCGSYANTITYCIDETLEENSYKLKIENDSVILCGSDSRSAAQAGYFIEDLMNIAEGPYLEKQETVRTPLFSPRMIHSGFGLDMFPDEHISAIAHNGINVLLLFVKAIDRTPHGYTDFNDLIYRAGNLGVDVYVYSYMHSELHPEDEGAEEFYEGLYGKLFEQCPGFKGVVFVGESCEFPSNDPHTTGRLRLETVKPKKNPDATCSPGWWPCYDFPQWIDMVKRIIRAKQPKADFVFWSYNWGWVEEKYRLALIDNLPLDVSLLVTFEMFENVEREGIINRTVDYTLFFEGPGVYFKSEAKRAKERGLRLYSMTNTGGLTWDIGTIPYEPAPYQWMRRYAEMQKAHDNWGLCGTMDCHHYGFWPSFISELAKWAFYKPSPDYETVLKMLVKRDWGEKNMDAVLKAYEYFSDGIRNLVSTNEDQYGPFRTGPSYPLVLFKGTDVQFPTVPYAHHGGNLICSPVYGYNLSNEYQWNKINYEIKCHTKSADQYEAGYKLLNEIYPTLDENKKDDAAHLINLAKFISNSAKTTVNVKEWVKLKTKLAEEKDKAKRLELITGLREVGGRELKNAEATLPLVEFDSRLGYEPSMEYIGGPLHINWKINLLREVLDVELTELENL